jgi:hypothetical protein
MCATPTEAEVRAQTSDAAVRSLFAPGARLSTASIIAHMHTHVHTGLIVQLKAMATDAYVCVHETSAVDALGARDGEDNQVGIDPPLHAYAPRMQT